MINSSHTMLSLGVLLLMGCGGGGGSSPPPPTPTPTADNAINTDVINDPSPPPNTSSTRLADNVISADSSLRVFDAFYLDLDLTRLEHQGHYHFLKVQDKRGNTLFLGQINDQGQIQVPVHVTANDFPLIAHIFSELATDKTTTIEVNYDPSFIQ